jgi:branched-chain amino acid transport system ATP-binding protein
MLTSPLLHIRDLHAGYGEVEILRGIELSVGPGEMVAVLGSNGAGKSTLNLAISGVVRTRKGVIEFDDAPIQREKPSAIVARGLVHVPEGRRIFPNMSVSENLGLGSYRRGASRRDENRDRVYSVFPRLRERSSQRAGTLSGGEQQMLAIGRGLMSDPKLLILDEPSLGLSPLLVEEMFALISRLNEEGLAILLVEQNVVQSLEVAHRAYILEHGSVVLSGSAVDIRTNPDLKRAFLGM